MSNIYINGIGIYLPENYINNAETAEKFGYDLKFVENKIGFKKLLRKGKNETVLDFCLKAFDNLIASCDLNIEDIELITVVTQNPDCSVPHTSALLHNKLNMQKKCITFDISQGCSGYCHALEIVKDMMIAKDFKKALIFTCDLYSKIVDEANRDVNMIFGDAATVTLLSNEKGKYYIKDSNFGTLPNSNDCLHCSENIEMKGNDVFNYACKEVPIAIKELLASNNLTSDDIDYYVFHQGTKFIVDFLKRLMNIDSHKTEFSATDIGNTVSSSIPIQLKDIIESNKEFKNIVLSGFGVGFTWGNILLNKERV